MSWFRNVTSNLYDADASAPIAAALLRGFGTPDFDRGMVEAAESGRIEIVKLCKA